MALSKLSNVTQVSTTDATPTNATAAAVTIGDNREGYVDCVVIARGTTDVKAFQVGGTVKRASGGSAAIVGTIQSLLTAQGDAGLATAACSIVSSANTVVPQVTGIVATNITWDVWFTVILKP